MAYHSETCHDTLQRLSHALGSRNCERSRPGSSSSSSPSRLLRHMHHGLMRMTMSSVCLGPKPLGQ